MKGGNKPWDKPFYERLEQSKKDRKPRIMRAQGKRLYKVIEKTPPKKDNTWPQGTHGFRYRQISAISYSWKLERRKVKIKWMKPKTATFLTLQGHSVTELPDGDQDEMEYYNIYGDI